MQQIISLVDITPSAKRLWTWSWTASGSLLTTAACLQTDRFVCVFVSVCAFRVPLIRVFSDHSVTKAQDSKDSACTTHAAAEQDQALGA